MEKINNIIKAELITYSVNKKGRKIATWVVTCNTATWIQYLTHRSSTRNARSKRAMSSFLQIKQTWKNPFIPLIWFKTGKGMQPTEEITGISALMLRLLYKTHMYMNLMAAYVYAKIWGVSKQQIGNLLMPYNTITGLVTFPDYGAENFFELRAKKNTMAQREIAELAGLMKKQYREQIPNQLAIGDYHIPFEKKSLSTQENIYRSVANSAFISYGTDHKERSMSKYKAMHDRLLKEKHMSCFQHICQNMNDDTMYESFCGFASLREVYKINGDNNAET